MGSTNFENEYRGPATMSDAYADLVDAARYEYGNNPYSGTIATTRGVIQDPEVKAPMTTAQVREHLKDWWEKDRQPQKWESAWAIPLAPQTEPDPDDWPRTGRDQPGWLFYGWAAC